MKPLIIYIPLLETKLAWQELREGVGQTEVEMGLKLGLEVEVEVLASLAAEALTKLPGHLLNLPHHPYNLQTFPSHLYSQPAPTASLHIALHLRAKSLFDFEILEHKNIVGETQNSQMYNYPVLHDGIKSATSKILLSLFKRHNHIEFMILHQPKLKSRPQSSPEERWTKKLILRKHRNFKEDRLIYTVLLLAEGKCESGLTTIQRGFPTGTSFVPAGHNIFARTLQTHEILSILCKMSITYKCET